MRAYSFKPEDRLCTSCGRHLSAPLLVVMETTPPVSLVAAVHRLGCAAVRCPRQSRPTMASGTHWE